MNQVKVEVTINLDGEQTKVSVPLEKATKVEKTVPDMSNDARDLELKLMTSDDNDDEKVTSLNVDVLAWAMKTLKAGKRKELLEFLNRNKDRLNPDLKEMLKETIQSYLKGTK